jgi:hypothetical protein
MAGSDLRAKASKGICYPNARYTDLPDGKVSLDEFGEENRLIMEWCDRNAPLYTVPLRRVWVLFLQHPELAKCRAADSPIPPDAALAIREADDVYNGIAQRLKWIPSSWRSNR